MQKRSWLKRIVITFLGASLVLVPSAMAQNSTITLSQDDIRPESMVYNSATGTFLVSSNATGTIYQVAQDGTVTPFIQNEALTGSVGMYLDETMGKLYVVNSTLASMVGAGGGGFLGGGQLPEGFDPSQLPEGFDPSQLPEGFDPSQLPEGFDPSQLPEGFDPNNMLPIGNMGIALLVFDVNTQALLLNVDLSDAAPQGVRFANDVTVDADGNAYVTDSLSGAIYRVDPQGNIAYLSDEQFGAQGFGLNGIVFKDGYLLVVKSSDGSLYKIPLDNPSQVTLVALSEALVGADGMTWDVEGNLVVVGGTGKLYTVTSTDNWTSATVTARDVWQGATDVVIVDGVDYVLAPNTAMPTMGADGQVTMPTETTAPQILGY